MFISGDAVVAKNRNKKRSVNHKGRNTGHKFVQLDEWLLKAPAYRLLSAQARALLVEFLRLYNGTNNGSLYMSQRDAARAIGVKNHGTAANYIRELINRGFIAVVVPGSFGQKRRHATQFRLTIREADGKPATKECMSLQLTPDEIRRVEERTPTWSEKKPTGQDQIPDGYKAEYEYQALRAENQRLRGIIESTTYNIPQGGAAPEQSEAA